MTKIEDILTEGDPWRSTDQERLTTVLRRTAVLARTAADRPRRRRKLLWAAPVAVGGVLALTAGGVVADSLLREKLDIEISYTTDTGVEVSCTAQIVRGSLFTPHRDEVVDYYRTHDFSDVGQRIYDYALVLTGDREAEPGVLPVSSEVLPDPGQPWDDADAFSFSLTSFLLTDTQVELGFSGSGDSALKSDCTGRLH